MKSKQAKRTTAGRPRVRRGNAQDADQLRADLVEAALRLFSEGGLEAVSIRSVAARVGVSPMTMYRYFADKKELLSGLASFAMQGMFENIQELVAPVSGARARHRTAVEAFLDYWNERPDEYCLVYGFTDARDIREPRSKFARPPRYDEHLAFVTGLTKALAEEIGAGTTHLKLAQEIRTAMVMGFLHGTLIFKRYPWSEPAVLRAAYVSQVQQAVERCLLEGPVAPAQPASTSPSPTPA